MSTNYNQRLANGEITVPADSFNQNNDPNVQPNPVNISVGGVPQHWAGTAPISKRDMKTAGTPLGERKSPRVMRFDEYFSSINESHSDNSELAGLGFSPNFDLDISDEFEEEKEAQAAIDFVYMDGDSTVYVEDVTANLSDDFVGSVYIKLSNGDTLDFYYISSDNPNITPRAYLKINGENERVSIDTILGRKRTVIGSILDYYLVKFVKSNK